MSNQNNASGLAAGSASSSDDRHDDVLARNRLLLLLTFASGAVDAICFLGLGKVFTAFMTGNFVFLGMRIAGAPGPHVLSVLVSMGAFAAGVFIATRVVNSTRGTSVWPRRVTLVLGLSMIAHAAFVALWIVVGGRPSLTSAIVLLGVSALAMGVQTAAVFSLGLQGVFTTAATATFTVLSGDSAQWGNTAPERHRLAALLVALTGGAVAGALLLLHARDLAPVLPLAALTLVVGVASRFGDSRSTSRESAGSRTEISLQPSIGELN
jgi:uncharacterized membrane protein YoaK (UPF0700 family)